MYLIVGLGNPGSEYKKTRHNIGFMTVDVLADSLGAKVDKLKFSSLTAECRISTEKCLIMKPQTYMNNSGEAVGKAASFYKIPPQNVIVISDDVTLAPGKLRIRQKGSAGGHNGLKSIISHLGSDEFVRIKVGIGDRESRDYDLADFVLGKLKKADMKIIGDAIDSAAEAVKLIISGNIAEAMNKYN